MNNLIQLKGRLTPKPNTARGGGNRLTASQFVELSDLKKLKDDLEKLYSEWNKKVTLIDGSLINVKYKRVVPKSKRISYIIFKTENANDTIRGAKFSEDEERIKHIITYFIPIENIKLAIDRIEKCILVMDEIFHGKIVNKDLEEISDKIDFSKYDLSKSNFINYVVDCANVEAFESITFEGEILPIQLTTLYDVGIKPKELLNKLDIKFGDFSCIDENTVSLNKEAMEKLVNDAPYLISMITEDISEYELKDIIEDDTYKMNAIAEKVSNFPKPTNEPVIGVIDTGFDENVYFKDWVDYRTEYLPDFVEITSEDKKHGTAIDSIIVDGPAFNPEYDDNCGRFRVRHFVVARKGVNNSLHIIRQIEKIVEHNLDIKVWNLSLGAVQEINRNFISQHAALLDELQYKYNIIFVVAGTNKDAENNQDKIGSPADSINSIVVNSIKSNGKMASYTRRGRVLEFFNKPDVCYFGGDESERMLICIGTGAHWASGTSIAAPWISRKVAYLIYKLGLSREIAKALIIDSATGWKNIDDKDAEYYGFGAVPIKIDDILNTPKDEIKFFVEGTSLDYEIYTHSIPVPLSNGMYPYIAKATLCYFPKCSRNQGVDYTNTELDIYFGRITEHKNKQGDTIVGIKSIKNNKQTDEDGYVFEEDARKLNRKWDNVKHLIEEDKTKKRAKKSYENPMWGLSIKTKERQNNDDGKGIKFGVVITLKEINGVNRYEDFIKQCSFRGWLVNKIDVENQIDLYNKAEEEIEFE